MMDGMDGMAGRMDGRVLGYKTCLDTKPVLYLYCVPLLIIAICIPRKENAFSENSILHYKASCVLF